jgi:hypothetical protein
MSHWRASIKSIASPACKPCSRTSERQVVKEMAWAMAARMRRRRAPRSGGLTHPALAAAS